MDGLQIVLTGQAAEDYMTLKRENAMFKSMLENEVEEGTVSDFAVVTSEEIEELFEEMPKSGRGENISKGTAWSDSDLKILRQAVEDGLHKDSLEDMFEGRTGAAVRSVLYRVNGRIVRKHLALKNKNA